MDEVLEVAELAADAGFEGAIVWLFRIAGLVAILAGIALWLFVEITVLVPIALVVVGLVLIVVPQIALLALEVVA